MYLQNKKRGVKMGIFDKIFGKKSKDLKIRDVSIEKGAIEKKITVKPNIEELVEKKDVEGLIKALKDKDIDVREWAGRALGKIGDGKAVEPLIQALKDENKHIRRTAAEALGDIGDERAIEPLIQTMKGKYGIVGVVTARGDKGLVGSIIQNMKDEEESIKKAAKEALDKIKAKKSLK